MCTLQNIVRLSIRLAASLFSHSKFCIARFSARLYWHDINENVESNSKNFIELMASAVKLSWVNVDSILYLAIAAFDGRLYLISAESIPDERLIYRMLVDSFLLLFGSEKYGF